MEEIVLQTSKVVRLWNSEKTLHWDLRKPTIKESFEYANVSKKLDLANPDSINPFLEGTYQFMEKLGLPTEVAQSLEIDQLNMIVERLMPKKNA